MKITNQKFDGFRLFILASGVAGVVVLTLASAIAQQPQIPHGWFKACSKQADMDICNVQNILTASNGQPITGISIIEFKGKVNRKVFQVTVPSGRLIPPGISLQVDNGKAQKLNYMICFSDRCIAEITLTDQLVGSFKKGTDLTLTSVNFQNQQNPIKVTLSGFTGAYNGEPMKQSDLEDRQKKLQEFVSKNNEDFVKKLKEEQDKAKTTN